MCGHLSCVGIFEINIVFKKSNDNNFDNEVGAGNIFSKFFQDICISLYFWILRGVSFLELFDLGPPSFAKMHIYVYIADLHGEVGQNILNGQTNMLTGRTCDFNITYHLQIPLLLL